MPDGFGAGLESNVAIHFRSLQGMRTNRLQREGVLAVQCHAQAARALLKGALAPFENVADRLANMRAF